MSRHNRRAHRSNPNTPKSGKSPILSLLFIFLSFLLIVFIRMEERRRGYELLSLQKEYHQTVEEFRIRKAQLAKLSRPEYVESIAETKGSLHKSQSAQIIHLTGAHAGEPN